MANGYTALLDAKIAQCDAEVQRIKDESARSIAAAKNKKDVLVKAKLMLAANPDAETLITQLKALGVW